MTALRDASELHAVAARLYVGRPVYHDRRDEWQMYSFDLSERPKVGLRSRAWELEGVHRAGAASSMWRRPTPNRLVRARSLQPTRKWASPAPATSEMAAANTLAAEPAGSWAAIGAWSEPT